AIRAVAVQGYPHASHAGQGDILNALPVAFRWSHRVLPLGTAEAATQIRRHQLQWFKKRKGAAAWVQEMVGGKRDASPRADDELWLDQDARHLAQDASDAAGENASGAVRFCCVTQVAIVMDPDPARADLVAGEILKALTDAGFPGRIETVNALEAYLGSLPGHGYPNLRRPLLSTRNIADLLPVTSVWPGLATNPSPFFPPQSPPLVWAATDGSTPFRVHLHDSDVGHTLVLGRRAPASRSCSRSSPPSSAATPGRRCSPSMSGTRCGRSPTRRAPGTMISPRAGWMRSRSSPSPGSTIRQSAPGPPTGWRRCSACRASPSPRRFAAGSIAPCRPWLATSNRTVAATTLPSSSSRQPSPSRP